MDYTPAQAARAVADGMYFPPVDMTAFLDGGRAVNRWYAAFRPDDVFGRWVMGSRDHD